MTPEEMAALLNGRQYGEEMASGDNKLARDSGLVVVFGASDDLLEFCGMVDDEVGAYQGTTVHISEGGLIVKRNGAIRVKAVWCPEELDCSWLIVPSVPFSPFDIMEDDELFCRGAVFYLDAHARASASSGACEGER